MPWLLLRRSAGCQNVGSEFEAPAWANSSLLQTLKAAGQVRKYGGDAVRCHIMVSGETWMVGGGARW